MNTLAICKSALKYEALIDSLETGDRPATASKERRQYIDQGLSGGGSADFLGRVQRYGVTEKGEGLIINPWFEDLLCLIGDLRLNHTLTTGCSQIGKTLSHSYLLIDMLCSGQLNVGWFYDTRTNLENNVPIQFHPIADSWIALFSQDHSPPEIGKQNTTRYQVGSGTGIFTYVSTTRSTGSGRAIAGGAVVSFQADAAILEERSQYPPGAADPIPRRLDASAIPTRPIRELGTPGGGLGIEAQMKDCDRYFYPHYDCPRCKRQLPLDPKGCLLRPSQVRDAMGAAKVTYLSQAGRPNQWFHADPNDPINTAYFACSACGHPITDEVRYAARMRCKLTGELASDFLSTLPHGKQPHPWKVGIHISPLSRVEAGSSLAPSIVRDGFNLENPEDWQQQRLGYPSQREAIGITEAMIRRAIAAPPINRRFYDAPVVIAGVDIGRSEDWLMVAEFYPPKNHQMYDVQHIVENTVRQVMFGGSVMRAEIPLLLQRYGVGYGLVDNEPSRESAMRLCDQTVLQMVDQGRSMSSSVREISVEDGGIQYPCWLIRDIRFKDLLADSFLLTASDGQPLYRLPEEWTSWIGNPSSQSPISHLTAPHRGDAGEWVRPSNHVDDLFFAAVFMEAAYYIHLQRPNFTSSNSASRRRTSSILREL